MGDTTVIDNLPGRATEGGSNKTCFLIEKIKEALFNEESLNPDITSNLQTFAEILLHTMEEEPSDKDGGTIEYKHRTSTRAAKKRIVFTIIGIAAGLALLSAGEIIRFWVEKWFTAQ